MAPYNRKEMILEYLRNHQGFVTVDELCKAMFVSGATIRRDLTELETSQLIRRTRGGAVLVEGIASEEPIDFRENKNVMQKQIIASLTRPHIRDGMTLFLDSSSTVAVLARTLQEFSNLRVITNGLKTAYLLSEMKNLQVMCSGGAVRGNTKALVGPSAVDTISRLNADLAIMSCRGFSLANGASEASEEEYAMKRQFLMNSKKAVLLCDSSKMDVDFLCRVAPLSRFAEVITERKEINEMLQAAVEG